MNSRVDPEFISSVYAVISPTLQALLPIDHRVQGTIYIESKNKHEKNQLVNFFG